MQTIEPIQIGDAEEPTRRLFETVNGERGVISNMIKTMAQSQGTLEGYLQFSRALKGGKIASKLREQIALTVAQANLCEYSLAQHAALGAQLGLTNDEIVANREARSSDWRTYTVLKFARNLVDRSGEYSTMELREAGYGDSEIIEIVAHVALNVFENYFNLVAQTDLEFTRTGVKVTAA